MDTELLKSLLLSYFTIVKRKLIDSVPKTIMRRARNRWTCVGWGAGGVGWGAGGVGCGWCGVGWGGVRVGWGGVRVRVGWGGVRVGWGGVGANPNGKDWQLVDVFVNQPSNGCLSLWDRRKMAGFPFGVLFNTYQTISTVKEGHTQIGFHSQVLCQHARRLRGSE